MFVVAYPLALAAPQTPVPTSLGTPSPFPSAVGGRGEAFLQENSRRMYQFFVDQSDLGTGLTKDRARNYGPDSPEHTVASIAATGYALTAYTIGVKRGWMPRAEAVARTRRVVDTMKGQFRKAGWYYHWLNSATGAREWNSEISTIDSALLFYGMVVARQGLNDSALNRDIDAILDTVDYRDMMTDGGAAPERRWISMGWRPEEGYLKNQWDHYFENLGLNIMALGWDPKMPADSWDALKRPVLQAEGRECLVGGNLFMHQMSHGYIDFKGKRDRLGYDYWVDGRNITLMQGDYAARNPKGRKGYDRNRWGFSASDIPTGYGGSGYPAYAGGEFLDDGTIAPPSALASAIFTPKETLAAAEAFYRHHPETYGRYGFPSGINATADWRSPDAIGIDQGQAMINIENMRDGCVQAWFMSHPKVQIGMKRVGFRPTKEQGERPLRR